MTTRPTTLAKEVAAFDARVRALPWQVAVDETSDNEFNINSFLATTINPSRPTTARSSASTSDVGRPLTSGARLIVADRRPRRRDRVVAARLRQNARAMSTWKPHALAKPHQNQLDLRRGDKVVSTVELTGVPAGTAGKIILANGFNWLRYRVQFTNGAELGDLDGRHIAPTGRAAKRLAKQR